MLCKVIGEVGQSRSCRLAPREFLEPGPRVVGNLEVMARFEFPEISPSCFELRLPSGSSPELDDSPPIASRRSARR
jgi:hypothetical protein